MDEITLSSKAMESVQDITEEKTDVIYCFLLHDHKLKGK